MQKLLVSSNKGFKAHYSTSAPIIDGKGTDAIWESIPNWYDDQYIWINSFDTEPSASDFSWKYKLAWDENKGDHQTSYQAFVYHISSVYDAIDINNEGEVVLLNDHIEIKRDYINGTYIWEAAFDVYDKNYISTQESQPVKLHEGKIMGWSMAYCDNDGKDERDHFFGTNKIEGEDKNLTWKSADYFGKVELIK